MKDKQSKGAANLQANYKINTGHTAIPKTYKLYIGGAFPRTESGRYLKMKNKKDNSILNISHGSKKDFKAAAAAARSALGGWAKRTPYNRAQITYRIAEMLEGRKMQFVAELEAAGVSKNEAQKDVEAAIDLLVYYTGWADKFQQIYSTVNPVSEPYFNFSTGVPVGVVSVIAPKESGLWGFLAAFIPAFVGGNTVIVLAEEKFSACAISFAEVLNSSDVPGGTINIITGKRKELLAPFTTHMEVNSVILYTEDKTEIIAVQESAAVNVKRTSIRHFADEKQSPYLIFETLETKTTWHPMGGSDGGGAKY